MITLRTAYQKSKEILSGLYSNDEVNAILKVLFDYQYSIQSKDFILNGDNEFPHEEQLDEILNRLSNNEPIQYVLGFEMFNGLKILLNSNALIPRPETEELLEWIHELEATAPKTVVDFCTGSGCIALSLKQMFPSANIFATDISKEAIELARSSEIENFNASEIHWQVQDLLNEPYLLDVPDLVVCNPPYIKLEEAAQMGINVMNFEPHLALFVIDDDALLFYKKVLGLFKCNSMPIVYFELNPLTADELERWCVAKGLICLFKNDLSGKKRFARISK